VVNQFKLITDPKNFLIAQSLFVVFLSLDFVHLNGCAMKNSIFIILQFIAGFAFGILGGYAFSFFNRYNDLGTSIVLALTSAFVSLLLGVTIVGFIYLKRSGRVKDLGRSMLLSLVGLLVFLIIYIGIDLLASESLPYFISSILLPIILPLTGAVLGFNYNNYRRQRL
jgi:hypothetical protein